jgi:hypothetical protein
MCVSDNEVRSEAVFHKRCGYAENFGKKPYSPTL